MTDIFEKVDPDAGESLRHRRSATAAVALVLVLVLSSHGPVQAQSAATGDLAPPPQSMPDSLFFVPNWVKQQRREAPATSTPEPAATPRSAVPPRVATAPARTPAPAPATSPPTTPPPAAAAPAATPTPVAPAATTAPATPAQPRTVAPPAAQSAAAQPPSQSSPQPSTGSRLPRPTPEATDAYRRALGLSDGGSDSSGAAGTAATTGAAAATGTATASAATAGAASPTASARPVRSDAEAAVAALSGVDATDGRLQMTFPVGSTELSANAQTALDRLAATLKQASDQRISIYGYASDADPSDARRTGLSRALVVRAYLLQQGIRSMRMDVRAPGNDVPDGGPKDRVDVLNNRS